MKKLNRNIEKQKKNAKNKFLNMSILDLIIKVQLSVMFKLFIKN